MRGQIRLKVRIPATDKRVKDTEKVLPERFNIPAAAEQFMQMYKRAHPTHEIWITVR